MGYGGCYVGGLRTHLEASSCLLELPEGLYPVYGLCMGQPDQEPQSRPRLPVEAIYHEGRYPDDETVLGRLDAYNETIREYEAARGTTNASWTQRMAEKFSTPRRTDLADYYRSQGANLG